MAYFTPKNLFCLQQFSFRPGHSTELASLKFVYHVITEMDNFNIPTNIYIDLSMALDTLNFDILLNQECKKLLNVCSNYATEHSLSYNANKSYSLCFKATAIKFERPTLYFGQMSIPNVTDCRYLGITISVKNCDLDLIRQKRRFYANIICY